MSTFNYLFIQNKNMAKNGTKQKCFILCCSKIASISAVRKQKLNAMWKTTENCTKDSRLLASWGTNWVPLDLLWTITTLLYWGFCGEPLIGPPLCRETLDGVCNFFQSRSLKYFVHLFEKKKNCLFGAFCFEIFNSIYNKYLYILFRK